MHKIFTIIPLVALACSSPESPLQPTKATFNQARAWSDLEKAAARCAWPTRSPNQFTLA